MHIITADDIEKTLAYPMLVDVLESAFRTGAIAPPRHHHTIRLAGRPDATLLLMPAWTSAAPGAATAGRYIGIKSVTVFPDAGKFSKPAVQGAYLLLSTETGEPLAMMDAPRLTVWRTAAASALAARHLAPEKASRMLMVGAGALAPYLVRAHASVRPIREVAIWNRSPAGAERLAQKLAASGLAATATEDLEAAVRNADIISTATLASEPLVRGAWLRPGTHIDCVGAFTPAMRETDDDVAKRARIWVDTREGALREAGDLVQPIKSGVIEESRVQGDLYGLARGTAPRRGSDQEITMFKSVGASIEDLAAAIAVYERLSSG
ncbi:MAG TPA: ornithine cyclodeaminase family protein [Hyphomicrobiaceae bacterium]|nr:ornithine cyclodeaminase family protein [Hyphomicrobiaceae bacterium]